MNRTPYSGTTRSRLRANAKTIAPIVLPILVGIALLAMWDISVRFSQSDLFPGPWKVLLGILELANRGLLLKYVIASLFRVTWGFFLAILVGLPLGLWMGWYRPAYLALNPFIQLLRPISPIAWIPLSILWFGISDASPVFLIFLASVFPIVVSAAAAVRNLNPVYIRAAENFELSRWRLFRYVILPGTLPQVLTGIRIALGIAWLVVVAAEMVAVNSGLGYLIIDARNAGKRYDLVVAGMVVIGLIGLMLDWVVRSAEKLGPLRWGFHQR